MLKNNNETIKRELEFSLDELKMKQSNYERMLQSPDITQMAKDIILDLLMEIDYQIRDYEENIAEAEGHDYEPLYVQLKESAKPVIQDEKNYQKVLELDQVIAEVEADYDFLQQIDQFRTEKGKNVHAKLVDLDKSQLTIIREELASEHERVKRLTSLTKEKEILRKLNKQDRYLSTIKAHEKTLDELYYPKYPNNYARNIVYIFYLDFRLARLRKKEGLLITQANHLIYKDTNKAKTLRKINNIPVMQ